MNYYSKCFNVDVGSVDKNTRSILRSNFNHTTSSDEELYRTGPTQGKIQSVERSCCSEKTGKRFGKSPSISDVRFSRERNPTINQNLLVQPLVLESKYYGTRVLWRKSVWRRRQRSTLRPVIYRTISMRHLPEFHRCFRSLIQGAI